MKSEMKERILQEHSNIFGHPGTLWLAILRTLLLVCFLADSLAEGISQQALVSYAFDYEA